MLSKNCGWMQKDTTSILIDNLQDPISLEIKNRIAHVADMNTNLLFSGETGVGKDFWANYLFEVSGYTKMVNLNCGDVPQNLLESEWFGYKKGAFTGAERDFEGKWRKAEGGILFLNQIDLLNLNLQARLLRTIERKKFFPLGSTREVDINVRFLFSADADIETKVRNGEFRQDLFYRISSYHIHIPPLRDRRFDIMPIMNHYAEKHRISLNVSALGNRLLLNHPWSGNIREIENFVRNIALEKKNITDEVILQSIRSSRVFFDIVKNSEMSLPEMEREYISFLLKKYKEKTKVAEILKISRKTLYNKLNQYEKD